MRETEQLLPSEDAAILMGAEACKENRVALGSDPFAELDDIAGASLAGYLNRLTYAGAGPVSQVWSRGVTWSFES